jgi:hypothetical protein
MRLAADFSSRFEQGHLAIANRQSNQRRYGVTFLAICLNADSVSGKRRNAAQLSRGLKLSPAAASEP